MPPEIPFVPVYCEAQSAIVTDNHDEQGLGRVRVKFHWMEGSEKSPWLRITTPHAGGGKGMFLMPEVGEEVIVGFEGDSPTKPYVIGSVYHGKAKCSFGNGGNDVKALQSRSGNKVVLNDQDNSVLIEDAEGNSVTLDGSGNIIIHSSASIALACGGGENGPASFIGLNSDGQITIQGNTISLAGINRVDLFAGSETTGSGVSIVPTNIDLVANENCNISGGSEANLNSELVQISGSTTNISGDTITVNGTADVGIMGGLVKINS
jgi:phage baseplate assembly protein gpV